MLGICRKANKIKLGFDPVESSLSREAALLLFTSDISPKTKERMLYKASGYKLKHIDMPYTSEELWVGIGKKVAVMSITDRGLARNIALILEETEQGQ